MNFIKNFLEKRELFCSIKLEEVCLFVCLFVVSSDLIITNPRKTREIIGVLYGLARIIQLFLLRKIVFLSGFRSSKRVSDFF